MTQISEMTDRELDAAIAVEICGWTDVTNGKYSLCGIAPWMGLSTTVWRYSTNLNACREAEQMVVSEAAEYTRQLRRVLNAQYGDRDRMPQLWRFATATARQRCEAMLMAVRAKEQQ